MSRGSSPLVWDVPALGCACLNLIYGSRWTCLLVLVAYPKYSGCFGRLKNIVMMYYMSLIPFTNSTQILHNGIVRQRSGVSAKRSPSDWNPRCISLDIPSGSLYCYLVGGSLRSIWWKSLDIHRIHLGTYSMPYVYYELVPLGRH